MSDDANKVRLNVLRERVRWLREVGFYTKEDAAEVGEWVKNSKALFTISATVLDDFITARRMHSAVPFLPRKEK
jgi:hypothetical protein